MVKESREDPLKDLKEEITEFVKKELPARSPMRTRVIKKILKDRTSVHREAYFFVKTAPRRRKGVTN